MATVVQHALDSGLDVLGVGEMLIQLTPPDGQRIESSSTLLLSTAGAESNVVTHLARMGHRTALWTAVGGDPWGERILTDLRAAGVDTAHVRVEPSAPTGLYVKTRRGDRTRVDYHRSGSAASRMDVADADGARMLQPRVLHTSGVLPALSTGCDALVGELLARPRPSSTLASFDVNHRPGLWDAAHAAPVLLAHARAADIVFVGRDEAETLWGCRDDRELRDLISQPRHLVMKDDDRAAVEWEGSRRQAIRPDPVVVRERVGAGRRLRSGLAERLPRRRRRGLRAPSGARASRGRPRPGQPDGSPGAPR